MLDANKIKDSKGPRKAKLTSQVYTFISAAESPCNGAAFAVHCLGQVEFLHPAFHNEKHIWPRGYRATSLVKSTASKGELAEHLCEILVSPSGSGPLFRWKASSIPLTSVQ